MSRPTVRFGGWSLILGAVAFMAVFGWLAARFVTDAVAPVAALNNYLLPAWMIVFGAVLARWREPGPSR